MAEKSVFSLCSCPPLSDLSLSLYSVTALIIIHIARERNLVGGSGALRLYVYSMRACVRKCAGIPVSVKKK